jgi:hypothetical protein
VGFVFFNGGFGRFVQNFFFNFGTRSTHLRCLFQDTRPQPRSSSSSAPAAGSSGHVGNRFPARGRHEPESLLLFGARVGHAPPFLVVHGVGWGLRWSIYCWVVPVTAHVLRAPPSPAESATVSLPAAVLGFLCFLCTFLCVYYGSQFVYL